MFLEGVVLCPSPISQTASLGHTRWSLNSAFQLALTDGWGWVPSFSGDPGLCGPVTQRDTLVFEGAEGFGSARLHSQETGVSYKKVGTRVDRTCEVGVCACVCLCAPVNEINRG